MIKFSCWNTFISSSGISNDNGNTFGPILMLGSNGTLTAGGGGQGAGAATAQ